MKRIKKYEYVDSRDGPITTKYIDKNNVTYLDINDYNKKYRSLRKYAPKSFKDLCFNILKSLDIDTDGKFEANIFTTDEFKFVYGQIKLIYSVKNNVAVLENIEPSQFFIDGYRKELDTYKGIPCRNEKDKFKIDMLMKMKEKEKENKR